MSFYNFNLKSSFASWNYKNIIKELRLRQGYTQVDLAELSSLSLRTIQRIENNEVEPTPYSLNQIGEVLGVNLNELKNNIMKQKLKSSNSWNILLHLSSIFGIITTTIIWVIFKRKDEIIEFQGRDVINFKFNWILLYIVFGVTSLLITQSWALLIIALVSLYSIGLIISIYNSIRVANNKDYTYPIFIRLLGHQ